MIFRLTAVWVTLVLSVLTAGWGGILSHVLSNSVNFHSESFGGRPIPRFSTLFYPFPTLIYFFPILLILWGLYFSLFTKRNGDHALLLCSVSVAATILFVFLFELPPKW